MCDQGNYVIKERYEWKHGFILHFEIYPLCYHPRKEYKLNISLSH